MYLQFTKNILFCYVGKDILDTGCPVLYPIKWYSAKLRKTLIWPMNSSYSLSGQIHYLQNQGSPVMISAVELTLGVLNFHASYTVILHGPLKKKRKKKELSKNLFKSFIYFLFIFFFRFFFFSLFKPFISSRVQDCFCQIL